PEHTLMLCWPPYEDHMAALALERYRGTRVIYIGEGAGGCTGNDAFHAALAEQWDLVTSHEIPQWQGLHDEVDVYARRGERHARSSSDTSEQVVSRKL